MNLLFTHKYYGLLRNILHEGEIITKYILRKYFN